MKNSFKPVLDKVKTALSNKKIFSLVLVTLTLFTVTLTAYGAGNNILGLNSKRLSVSGVLEANQVNIRSQSSGYIQEVPVEEGDTVAAGQVMAKLNNLDFNNKLFEAQANLEVAKAKYDQVNSGPRQEEVKEANAVVSQAKIAMGNAQKAVVVFQPILSEIKSQAGDVGGQLTEEMDKLSKVLEDHSNHKTVAETETAPPHQHSEDSNKDNTKDSGAVSSDQGGQMGEDCAQLAEHLKMVNDTLTDINKLMANNFKNKNQLDKINFNTSIKQMEFQLLTLQNVTALAQANLDAANARYKLVQMGPRKEDVQSAHAELKKAQVAYEIAKQDLDKNTVIASMVGLVIEKKANSGDMVTEGQSLFTLLQLDNIYTEVKVPVEEADGIKKNMKVEVLAKEYPGTVFKGKVWNVYPDLMGDDKDGKSYIILKVKVDNSKFLLKPGLPVEVVF